MSRAWVTVRCPGLVAALNGLPTTRGVVVDFDHPGATCRVQTPIGVGADDHHVGLAVAGRDAACGQREQRVGAG
jgi:hypothetical protein